MLNVGLPSRNSIRRPMPEQLLAAIEEMTCPVCGKKFERVTLTQFGMSPTATFRIECHGATDTAEIDRLDMAFIDFIEVRPFAKKPIALPEH